MSKQHTKPTISNRLRRGLAGILTLALLLGLLPSTVVTAHAHWADPYVETLAEWGVMRGDINGNMAPERTITRAEFVTMMNRAYGYTRLAGHPFTDVRTRDWYSEDIDIAYNMGYFKGTSPTTASPNSPLTREQAAVLLARNMMLQETVGETLGFSDTRSLSDWSRGLVGAATENGILGGYSDGSFKPQNNITRGEVAAMLVRAIGTPIQEAGDHTLGNVYGNVTVNTSGVKLRDGVITGNLYLTGGIDLGDVLLENVTVLGEIVVSGSGESNSAQSSIVLRNVKAKNMSVDNISGQFVTIRAEGNTDINTTTVRTSAFVDDSSLPGYGLWKIIQDGGSLLQLAGNAKEVVNQTPNSELQIVQGSADKVTIDEKATGSSVLVDGDARVDELDLDVATSVTGEGDIKDLNVGAAGSTVEQLPDTVTIRPGITADINGSEMNSSQAAQASSEPRLLAGYPKAKNIAPTSATLVFSVNKPGTIYWAISAVADGSVSEDDLIENPTYGGKIVQAGTINATAANTEYTANLTGLTQDGSYYISAILVDGRDKRSPVKVTAFATPDGTVPAFISGPTVTMRTTKTAQVTGMPNKSCQLYWALLPEGATAPTAAQFKANAVTGNLGYGSMDVVKNSSQSVNVNRGALKEKTNYVAYLWLTDHDGAQSSQVYRVPIYIPDETPPIVNDMKQTGGTATAVEASFTMNETGRLHWSIVTDEDHEKQLFLAYDGLTTTTLLYDDEDVALGEKIRLTSGAGNGAPVNGAIVSGITPVTGANTLTRILSAATEGLDPELHNTSSFVLYYVGEDDEGNLSDDIGFLEVNVVDETDPEFVEQTFSSYNQSDLVHPLADTDITLVFSEPVQNGASRDRNNRFRVMYQAVEAALGNVPEGEDAEKDQAVIDARAKLAQALYKSIKLYDGTGTEVISDQHHPNVNAGNSNYILDYRYATVDRVDGRMYITFPHDTGFTETTTGSDGSETTVPLHAANLKSGTTYHFELRDIYDCAVPPRALQYNAASCYRVPDFRTAVAEVSLRVLTLLPSIMYSSTARNDPNHNSANNAFTDFTAKVGSTEYGLVEDLTSPTTNIPAAWNNNPPQRIDRAFLVNPLDSNSGNGAGDEDMFYDILIWSDSAMEVSLYSRPAEGATDTTPWELVGSAEYTGTTTGGTTYRSLFRDFKDGFNYDTLNSMEATQYAIHVDRLYYGSDMNADFFSWNKTVQLQVTVVAGPRLALQQFYQGNMSETEYNAALAAGASSIGVPDPLEGKTVDVVFTDRKAPDITNVSIVNSDRYPEISVLMNRPGAVNYMFVPLTSLTLKDGRLLDDSTIITEDMITNTSDPSYINTYTVNPAVKKVAGGGFPLISDMWNIATKGSLGTLNPGGTYNDTLLAEPTRYTVTDGYPAPGVIRGQTESVPEGTAAEIDLVAQGTPLQPNTIYYLCLVPQGVGTSTVSENVFGWRFTTQPAKRPVIELSNGQTTDGNSINVLSTVDTTAAVWSILVNQNMLNQTAMAGNMTKTNVATDKWDEFESYLKNDLKLTADKDGNYSYTILQAMRDNYTKDGQTPHGSVFDYFASSALQESVRSYIESGQASASVVVGRWDSNRQTIPANRETQMDFRRTEMMTEEHSYICFAVARVDPNDNTALHGFRALYPVELQDPNGPKIETVATGSLRYSETNGLNGSITVNFDKTLYLIINNERLLFAPQNEAKINSSYGGVLGKIDSWDKYLALRTNTQLMPRTSFTIDINRMDASFDKDMKSFSFSLPQSLCSLWNMPASGSITVTYNPDSPDASYTGFVVTMRDDMKADNYYIS